MRALLFAAFAVVACSIASVRAAEAELHPQDGAHADVRIEINESGVRFDLVMNLAFVDAVAPVYREDLSSVATAEEAPVRDGLMRFYSGEDLGLRGQEVGPLDMGSAVRVAPQKVEIDGVAVTPVLRAFKMIRPGDELLPLFPLSGRRGLVRAQLVIEYPAKAPPSSVKITWGAYPQDLLAPPISSDSDARPPIVLEAQLTAEGRLLIVRFTQDEPEYSWHTSGQSAEDRFMPVPSAAAPRKPLRIPLAPIVSLGALLAAGTVLAPKIGARRAGVALLAMAVVGAIASAATWNMWSIAAPSFLRRDAELPTTDEAVAIFTPLHANIYRAFDYEKESDIYDALARSVDGDLLDSLYNEVFQSLILQEEGGAVCRVQSVTPVSTEVTNIGLYDDPSSANGKAPGFTVRARWRVKGAVYHWGHSHFRTNEYLAEYAVLKHDAGWRISSSRTIEQFRVDSDPTAPMPAQLVPGGEL